MKVKVTMAVVLLAAGIAGNIPSADEKQAAGDRPFERIKQLAGEWTGKASFDEGGTTAVPIDTTVVYKVTSGGSAVMETLFPGTDHEMVTMYHRNGDDLILTHYCAAGNQPRMKAQKLDNQNRIIFKFLDGTNLDSAKDMHMHEAVIEFVDAKHVKTEWTSYQDGKPAGTARFDLKRKHSEQK
jgi:hypothetical protein